MAKISKTLMRRLPLYLEYLNGLSDGCGNISATAIADALGLGDVQVRKDLAKVAGGGRCRTGRSREQLIRDIDAFLENASRPGTILVSSVPLEPQVLQWVQQKGPCANLLACFALNPTDKQNTSDFPIYSINRLETFCRHYEVHWGIIAVPEEDAQTVCDCLIVCGIQTIWNVTSAQLNVPTGVVLLEDVPRFP